MGCESLSLLCPSQFPCAFHNWEHLGLLYTLGLTFLKSIVYKYKNGIQPTGSNCFPYQQKAKLDVLDLEKQCFPKGIFRVALAIIFILLLTFTTIPMSKQSCPKMRREPGEGEEDQRSGQYNVDTSFTDTSGKCLLAHEWPHLHTLLTQYLSLGLQQFSQHSPEEGRRRQP